MCALCMCSYLLVLSQYEAVSFGDAVFASYVLLGLQQRQTVLLRKAVWGEHATVLHSLSIPADQVNITASTVGSRRWFGAGM